MPFPDGERVLNVVLRPDQGVTLDQCGLNVAIADSVIVLGCPNDATFGVASGSAVVFELETSTGEWKEKTRLRSPDPQTFDFFGFSIATDGETILIGAFGRTIASFGEGMAYVFERNSNGEWGLSASLEASDRSNGDQFGRSVAVLEGTAIVGASFGDGEVQDGGAVYVFEKDTRHGWKETAMLQASDATPFANFGTALSIGEGRFVVGSFSATNSELDITGAAYVFELDETSRNWVEVVKIVPQDGDDDDQFSTQVALDGDTIAFAAPGDDDAGENFGAVYIFEAQYGNFTQVQKITTSNSCNGNCFASGGLALEKNVLTVGSTEMVSNDGNDGGVVFVFEADGRKFEESVRLVAAEGALTGVGVAVSDGRIVVGSPGGEIQGIAFVADLDGIGDCTQQITGFTLVDPSSTRTERLVGVVDLDGFTNHQVNIQAEVQDCGEKIPFVRVAITDIMAAVDQRSPFDLFDGFGVVPRGRQNIGGAICDDPRCDSSRGSLDVEVFIDMNCPPTIVDFIAYDAFSDQPLATVSEGSEICLPESGELNFEVMAQCVETIDLRLWGTGRDDERREASPPYFMYGDYMGDVLPQYGGSFDPGSYTLTASYAPDIRTPRSSPQELEVSFSMVDCTGTGTPPSQSPSLSHETPSPSEAPSLQPVVPDTFRPTTMAPTLRPSLDPTSAISHLPTSLATNYIAPTNVSTTPSFEPSLQPSPTPMPTAATFTPATTRKIDTPPPSPSTSPRPENEPRLKRFLLIPQG